MKTHNFKVHLYVDVPAESEELNNAELGAAVQHVKYTLESHLEHLSKEMHRFKLGRLSIDYLGTKKG